MVRYVICMSKLTLTHTHTQKNKCITITLHRLDARDAIVNVGQTNTGLQVKWCDCVPGLEFLHRLPTLSRRSHSERRVKGMQRGGRVREEQSRHSATFAPSLL